MRDSNTTVREDPLFKHIAGVTGSALDTTSETWGVYDLAKSWLGKKHLCVLAALHKASCAMRIAASDIWWTFRPNGQAWWWLTLAVLIAFVAGNYMR